MRPEKPVWPMAITACTGWFALIAQYILMLQNREVSVAETSIRFFSFFTILTNLLFTVYCTVIFLHMPSTLYSFFNRPGVLTAITIYILVVGTVYQIILRPIWDPQGLQKVVDELLHSVQPALGLFFWFIYENRKGMRKAPFWKWLIYPVVYLIWILLFGGFSGFYPYPFVDVPTLGYGPVFLNCGAVVLLFVFFIFLFRRLPFLPEKKA